MSIRDIRGLQLREVRPVCAGARRGGREVHRVERARRPDGAERRGVHLRESVGASGAFRGAYCVRRKFLVYLRLLSEVLRVQYDVIRGKWYGCSNTRLCFRAFFVRPPDTLWAANAMGRSGRPRPEIMDPRRCAQMCAHPHCAIPINSSRYARLQCELPRT